MIIEMFNFGPINYLKFDLTKDLNLIYGENAVGKSYATYLLYSIIKKVKNKRVNYRSYQYYQDKRSEEKLKKIRKEIKSLQDDKIIDVTHHVLDFIGINLEDILLNEIEQSLRNTFSSLSNLKNQFTNEEFEIRISLPNSDVLLIKRFNDNNLQLNFSSNQSCYKLVSKNTKTTAYSLTSNGKKVIGSPNANDFYNEYLVFLTDRINVVLRALDNNVRDIYYLPASRSGLYQALNSFTPIVAELTQSRFFLRTKSIELPTLSEPLSDYFIDLSTLDKTNENEEYNDIIKILENDILKGSVKYDNENKKITYSPVGIKLELNLSQASSMVSELSPLVLYFRHILNHKFQPEKSDPFYFDSFYRYGRRNNQRDIIIIEEPEAHLHPLIQIKLMEVFVELAKRNIRLFITSHSNYMFNKLNNLIIKGESSPENIKVYHLVRETNGGTKDGFMEIDEDGINDNNFQDVSLLLYNERMNSL